MAGKHLTQEVTVQLPNGARVGVRTADDAARLYPGAQILSYGDGRLFDGPAVSKQPGDMTRGELNRYAVTVGVPDPDSYATKAELIAVIEAAANGPAETGTDPDSPEDPDGADES